MPYTRSPKKTGMPYTRSPKKKGNNMSSDFPFDFFPSLLAVRATTATVNREP